MKKKSLTVTMIGIIVLVIAIAISLVFVFNQKDTKAYNSKLEQAQKYVSKVDYKEAEAAYLEAIKIDPKQTKAYVKLADVYMDNGKEDKAVAILNKAYKNVESTADKKEIKDKQKNIQEKIKNGETAINNGGDYVTYKGKSYYWEYTHDSFDNGSRGYGYLEDAKNKLVCIDNKGNKETIYEGKGFDDLWIYKDKIYFSYPIDSFSIDGSYSSFSVDLDGSNLKAIGNIEISEVCSEGLIVNNYDNHEFGILTDNKFKKVENFTPYDELDETGIGIEIDLMSANDENIYYSVSSERDGITNCTLKSMNVKTNKTTVLTKIGAQECIGRSLDNGEWLVERMHTAQVIENTLYFSFDWANDNESNDSIHRSGSKIAKVKTDGTGFNIIKESDDEYYYSYFTVYKDKEENETINVGGRLNKPFKEEDEKTKSDIAYMYSEESTNKREILSPNEYSSYGTNIDKLTFDSNNLYFSVSDENEAGDVSSYTYGIKNLKTNKITIYLQIKLNN